MKYILSLIVCLLLFFTFANHSYAIYDPISATNNQYGIHILYPEEVSEASNLVNSTGGEWGYVAIPIKESDKDLVKWQKFMDDCARFHIIPIIRLATDGDYFVEASWQKPNKYSIIDFANFLNSLSWPTKNRYVVIYNEPNRWDEWGGDPNPVEYADILNYAVDVFKSRSDKFFIISAGLDNAAPDIYGRFINQFNYIREMNNSIPGLFTKIDGLAVHAYPNPSFSSPPTYLGPNSINSFSYEQNLINSLSGKALPIFITETGWSTDLVSQSLQASYYQQAFENVWNDKNIVAVTPFVLHADQGPFRHLSFIVDNKRTQLYEKYLSFPKIKGLPQIEAYVKSTSQTQANLKTINFSDEFTKSVFSKINNETKTFFKWLLNI